MFIRKRNRTDRETCTKGTLSTRDTIRRRMNWNSHGPGQRDASAVGVNCRYGAEHLSLPNNGDTDRAFLEANFPLHSLAHIDGPGAVHRTNI